MGAADAWCGVGCSRASFEIGLFPGACRPQLVFSSRRIIELIAAKSSNAYRNQEYRGQGSDRKGECRCEVQFLSRKMHRKQDATNYGGPEGTDASHRLRESSTGGANWRRIDQDHRSVDTEIISGNTETCASNYRSK
jgi:hypothetical protein